MCNAYITGPLVKHAFKGSVSTLIIPGYLDMFFGTMHQQAVDGNRTENHGGGHARQLRL